MFNQRSRMHYSQFDTNRKRGSLLGRLLKFLFILLVVGLLAALVLFSISSCQEKAANTRILSFASRNACEFRYEGVGLSLVENHCGANQGVYFMTPQGMYTAPLIHPAVSAMVQKYGCDSPNTCTFNLEVQADSMGGEFNYLLNGQKGFYTFEWPRDQQPRLVDSSNSEGKS